MARIPLTVQALGSVTAATGAPPPTPVAIAFAGANALGHEFLHDARAMIVFKAGAGGSGTLTIVSKADPFGRLGDQVVTIAAGEEKYLGPFLPKANWGDGTKVFADPSSLAGSVSIAVIKV